MAAGLVFCAVMETKAIQFEKLHAVRDLHAATLVYLMEEAGDLADGLRLCGKEVRAERIDWLGRFYEAKLRELERTFPPGGDEHAGK